MRIAEGRRAELRALHDEVGNVLIDNDEVLFALSASDHHLARVRNTVMLALKQAFSFGFDAASERTDRTPRRRPRRRTPTVH